MQKITEDHDYAKKFFAKIKMTREQVPYSKQKPF